MSPEERERFNAAVIEAHRRAAMAEHRQVRELQARVEELQGVVLGLLARVQVLERRA